MPNIDLSKDLKQSLERIKSVKNLDELNEVNLLLVTGKSSLISKLSKQVKDVSPAQKRTFGRQLNDFIEKVKNSLEQRKTELLEVHDNNGKFFDVTFPVKKASIGHLSPDTQVIRMMNDFFTYHGYSVAEGPEIETDDYNFERTNLPKDHPARDLQDTIYIENPEILLRTHTSSVETRILNNYKPPLRFVVPGISFRNEIINQSNHAIFQQYQGVVVDKGISMANLKGTLTLFARHMFGEDIKTRFRTKYYPEVEPGAGMDVLCTFCQGSGCRVCKGRGWLEILGSGMIHRELLKKCGIDFNEWSGFAFGMGLDRIIMAKFGISDIRDLHGGNLVFV